MPLPLTRPGNGWRLMVVLAALTAAYGFATALVGPPIFAPNLKASFVARPWGIYPHAFFGGIAMILGPFQFHRGLLRNRARHRKVGQAYVAACLIAGMAGLYMAIYSYGGMITHLGFGGLAVALLTTTGLAFRAIKARDVATHREWMIRSYAMIFAAVMLRIEIPPLRIATQGNFDVTYRIVAWLCWVPNILVAELIVRQTRVTAAAGLPAF